VFVRDLLHNHGAVLPPFRVPHVFACVRSLHVYSFRGWEAYLQGHDLHLGTTITMTITKTITTTDGMEMSTNSTLRVVLVAVSHEV
jgi:hypothetical protein